jgi:hypothetical protein
MRFCRVQSTERQQNGQEEASGERCDYLFKGGLAGRGGDL